MPTTAGGSSTIRSTMRTSASSRTSISSPRARDRKRTPRPSEPPNAGVRRSHVDVSVVSFTPILWNLAGPLTIFGVTVPKALFWMALVYVFFTTVVAFWIGRPLIRLSFRNELTNAAFRYALVRLRDAGEAVGFYRGEGAERGRLMTRFGAVIANYRAFVRRGVAFLGWNRSVSQIVDPTADDRPGPPVVRRTDSAWRHHPVVQRVPTGTRLTIVLSSRLRLVRQLPGGHHSPRRADRRQRNSTERYRH